MNKNDQPVAVIAADAPTRTRPSLYPEPFASMMKGREKRPLGDLFGLTNFGVNLTRISPGGVSASGSSLLKGVSGAARAYKDKHQFQQVKIGPLI